MVGLELLALRVPSTGDNEVIAPHGATSKWVRAQLPVRELLWKVMGLLSGMKGVGSSDRIEKPSGSCGFQWYEVAVTSGLSRIVLQSSTRVTVGWYDIEKSVAEVSFGEANAPMGCLWRSDHATVLCSGTCEGVIELHGIKSLVQTPSGHCLLQM